MTYTKSVLFMGAAVLAERARAVAETIRASPSSLLPCLTGSPGVVLHERKLKQPIDVLPSSPSRGASAASQRTCGSQAFPYVLPLHFQIFQEAFMRPIPCVISGGLINWYVACRKIQLMKVWHEGSAVQSFGFYGSGQVVPCTHIGRTFFHSTSFFPGLWSTIL